MVVESHAKHAGGGPVYWSQLSEHLIRRGHEVLILSGTPADGQFASPNTVGLLPVGMNLRKRSISTLMRRYLFRRRFVPLVREFAQEWQPDIIHTVPPIASEAALRAGKALDVPVVASVLSHVEAQWPQLERGRGRRHVFRFLESRALKKSYSRIICLTHRSEQVLTAEGVPAERLVYVPHAVDVTRFRSRIIPKFRRQLKLSNESMVIGYAGALTREKGFDQLLDAMKQLKPVENFNLLVAGEVLAKDNWQKVSIGLARVHFLGRLEHRNMPEFMASLDLFVIPSYTETLPTTLLEALATGTPVMATEVGGVSEFLRDEWGVILESSEASSIVSALEEWSLRRVELEKMGRRGQHYVREQHNWERTSELTERVYQSCLTK